MTYTLWYHSSCPLSRQVRAILKHLPVEHKIVRVEYWKPNNKLFDMSPFGTVPLLKTPNVPVVDSIYAIIEYFASVYPNLHLFPRGIALISEGRRLLSVINERFYLRVSKCIVQEKFIRLVTNAGSPRSEYLRSASASQSEYFEYISFLVKERGFLLYDKVSIVDIAFAAHISILDYFGMIDWYKYTALRSWYQIIKSFPYFRSVLEDKIGSFTPPDYYLEPDF